MGEPSLGILVMGSRVRARDMARSIVQTTGGESECADMFMGEMDFGYDWAILQDLSAAAKQRKGLAFPRLIQEAPSSQAP